MLVVFQAVEQQQHHSLKARNYQLLTALGECRLHLAMRQCVLPIQLSSSMLALVVQLEVVYCTLDVRGYDDRNIRIGRPRRCGQDVDIQIQILALLESYTIFQSLLIRLHFFASELDVLEHLLQVLGKSTTTLGLQARQHATFRVGRSTPSHE